MLNHQKFTDPCGGLSNSPNPVLSCCGLAAPLGTAIRAVPVMPSLSWRRLTSMSDTVVRCAPGVLLGGANASLAATRRGAIISTSMPSRLCREASSSAAATRRRRNPVVLCLLCSPAGARGRKTNSYQLSRRCARRDAHATLVLFPLFPPRPRRGEPNKNALRSRAAARERSSLCLPRARARQRTQHSLINPWLPARGRGAQTIVDISPFLPARGRGELRGVQLGSPAEPGTQHSTNFLFLGPPRGGPERIV